MLYYDKELGDVFIHFNINEINDTAKINKRTLKKDFQK
jgi:hypothetical protein